MKKTVRKGALSATLTQLGKGAQAGSWKVLYRNSAGKIVSGGILTTEARARKRADDILGGMLSTTIRDLSDDESRLILRLRKEAIPIAAITPAIDDLAATRRINVCDAVEIFMAREVETAHYSRSQLMDYRRILTELNLAHEWDDISSLTTERLEKWADSWGVGEKRYNNKRTILILFFRWAVGRGYLAKNPAEGLPRKRLPRKPDHEVFTPKQFAKMLLACPDSHLPWLAISGFAGCRGVEIHGRTDDRKSGLRWEDFDWQRRVIVLRRTTAKQTSASKTRIIPICDALADWLSPWRNATGHVYPPSMRLPNSGVKSLTKALGDAIGLPWPANALRASRASYRLAETGCVGTVSLEMGHSSAMLTGVYLSPRMADAAKQWFSLDRKTAARVAAEPDTVDFGKTA